MGLNKFYRVFEGGTGLYRVKLGWRRVFGEALTDVAQVGPFDRRRNGKRPVGGAEGAGDPHRPAGRLWGTPTFRSIQRKAKPVKVFQKPQHNRLKTPNLLVVVGSADGQLSRFVVQTVDQVFQRVVGLGDRRAAERVGLDEVGAGLQIRLSSRETIRIWNSKNDPSKVKQKCNGDLVDVVDDVRLGDGQQVVVAFEILGVAGELGAAEVVLLEPVALDHGAHGAVDHQNPPAQLLLQPVALVRFAAREWSWE